MIEMARNWNDVLKGKKLGSESIFEKMPISLYGSQKEEMTIAETVR
jgi:hypothetical protein